ncbi:MAG: bifunctional metallophosphatase/5'-nucleotidase [Defluviicoccus sp.]
MTYTLQLLHASDLEGSVDAIGKAPNFAALVDKLEDAAGIDASVTISAGDNYISGPFFSAAGDPSLRAPLNAAYNALFGLSGDAVYKDLREAPGRVDVSIMNIVGFDASALGNHEFDLGTSTIREIIAPDFRAAGLADDRWVGSQFPYLSANLDFSADPNLASLFTGDILPNTAFASGPEQSLAGTAGPKIAPATVIEAGGHKIGVVGATTPLLQSISSPGATTVKDPGAGTNDMAALATILQPTIDALEAQGITTIVLTTHLQQLSLEKALVPLLSGVDISIAGGSDSILANADDPLNPGDTAVDAYPVVTKNKDGEPAVIVSTDGEYSYVGRLVVRFNDNGVLVDANGAPIDAASDLDAVLNGPVATSDAAVAALWGSLDAGLADGTKGGQVKALVDSVDGVVIAQDSAVFGRSDVFLEGRRTAVRTEETNFGNLTADANLAIAKETDPSVVVSIKNGGGIRNAIGTIVEEPAGSGTYVTAPTEANPAAGKDAGEISQLDIADSLRFNNALTLVTVSADQLVQILEHGVAATASGATPGQFPQVGGVSFSFDPALPAGERVQTAAIIDEDGAVIEWLAKDGAVVGDPARPVRVVTLNFLADGGDNYPFKQFIEANPAFASRVDLAPTDPAAPRTGAATFAKDGTEQDALAEYLASTFPADDDPSTPVIAVADTETANDTRIQNLAVREDTVGTTEGAMGFKTSEPSMVNGLEGYTVQPVLTIGETIKNTSGDFTGVSGDYTPIGLLDGIGAFKLDDDTVRLLVNHEARPNQGATYTVNNGLSIAEPLTLQGARVSYFDISTKDLSIEDAGQAYNRIFDLEGRLVRDVAQIDTNPNDAPAKGFDRFCSSSFYAADEFGAGLGFADPLYVAPSEGDNGVNWILDVETGDLHAAPALGRGRWENVTTLNTGDPDKVAILLGDDSYPADPLYLYVGTKDGYGDGSFLDRNGLKDGQLFAWAPDANLDGVANNDLTPADFTRPGQEVSGTFVPVDAFDRTKAGDEGYDDLGWALQSTLYKQVESLNGFFFSRVEDLATNPNDDTEATFAATGTDFNGITKDGVPQLAKFATEAVDTTGSIYTVKFDLDDLDAPEATIKIVYRGDADAANPANAVLRSPDNVDWTANNFIFVNEDQAEVDFGDSGNPHEASIVRLDLSKEQGDDGFGVRVAEVNRLVVPAGTTDSSPDDVGRWETSGILDVSDLFGKTDGTLFAFDVQAHSLGGGIITEKELIEGGQLSFLLAPQDATPLIA